jgi:urea transport system substrate-binding protein
MTAENPDLTSTLIKSDPPPEQLKPTDTPFARADTQVLAAPGYASGTALNAWIGKTLGKYRITEVLGHGGMGVVLKAHDSLIERDVAIKVLASHLVADTAARGRFLAEAKSAGKVNHPNVIAIHEVCQEGETYYLVLEYVAGASLGDRLSMQGSSSVAEATKAMIDACEGVGAAHAAGLFHRDIKPANLMRTETGTIKVADFGLAKAATETLHFTQTGTVVGTPCYMSPEQCEAKAVDHRSDIYSLGATYYSLLTGKSPYFQSNTVPQLMYLHCHGPVPDPRAINSAIPDACSRVVGRAMAKDPADRYQTTAEMLADLHAVLAGLSGQTRQIELPSESGFSRKILRTKKEWLSRSGRLPRPVVAIGSLLLIGLLAVSWRPWENSIELSAGTATGFSTASEPIKIGILHSLSGTMVESESVVVDAALFAIEELNKQGGVLGRQVQPVVADGRSDWPTFAREAERLIVKEKVCTVLGCWTSASRKTVKPVFEHHDHLLIYPVQFEGLETSPNIIYMGAAPNQQILPAAMWAVKSLQKKRFFLVGSDYVFPRAANAILKDYLQSAGAQVVGEIYLPLGSQNADAVVSAVAAAKPDMIFNTINGDSNTGFFRALLAAGITPAETPTLSFSVGEQELRSLNAADLAGGYACWTYFQSLDTPINKAFVERFREKYPGRCLTDPMATAYDAVKLWAQAVSDAQSLDPKKIRRAMLGQRTVGPAGESRIDPDTQYCLRTPRIGQVQPDGQFKIVWSAAEPVEPDPYPNSRTAEEWHAVLHDLYTGWGNRWAAPALRASSATAGKNQK